MLQEERNPLIEEQLVNLKYTKESIDSLKATLNRLRKVVVNNCFAEAWKQLLLNKEKKSRISLMKRNKESPKSIYSVVLPKLF